MEILDGKRGIIHVVRYGILIEKCLCCKVGTYLGSDFLCSVAYVL